jgi:streptogramin lyase
MANAFANASNLVALNMGVALSTTPVGNGTVPTAMLNTIANVIAACVQSSGYGGPGSCADLFAFTGTPSTMDTATAAIRLAQNPAGVSVSGVSVSKLFNDIPTQAAFASGLSTAPNDYAIGIAYEAGLYSPGGAAVDAAGNVWVSSNLGANNSNVGKLIAKLSPLGVPAPGSPFSGGGLSNPANIAIDSQGYVWVQDSGVNSNVAISKFASDGTPVSTTGYSYPQLPMSVAIAIDGNDDVWVTQYGGSLPGLVELSNAAAYLQSPDNGTGGLEALAIDAQNNVWFTNQFGLTLLNASQGYAPTRVEQLSNGGGGSPYELAIDHQGYAWATSTGSTGDPNLTRWSSDGSTATATSLPLEPLAIDGAGNVWAADRSSGILEFSGSGSQTPATQLTPGIGLSGGLQFMAPQSLSVDGSGDLWLVSSTPNQVFEFLGAAAPVVTPLSAGVKANKLGVRP